MTANSSANRAIIAYLSIAHKYYRFYNDGDGFGGMHSVRKTHMGGYHKEYPHDEFNERIAEEAVDKAIIRVWKATKEAILPVVDELEFKEYYDVYEGRGHVTYEKIRTGRSGGGRFYKILLDS